eukprot:3933349-Rhodomonas_salina.5
MSGAMAIGMTAEAPNARAAPTATLREDCARGANTTPAAFLIAALSVVEKPHRSDAAEAAAIAAMRSVRGILLFLLSLWYRYSAAAKTVTDHTGARTPVDTNCVNSYYLPPHNSNAVPAVSTCPLTSSMAAVSNGVVENRKEVKWLCLSCERPPRSTASASKIVD